MKKKPNQKSKKFYARQTAQSRVKAEIITKYAASRAMIMTGKGVTKVLHIDLWAGRGRYEDGSESNPLMVLRNAIADPVVSKSLVTIFNDKDHADELRAEINKLAGVGTLAYAPQVSDMEVGAATPEIFEKIQLAPTLAFLDPWGYAGLTRDLIQSLLKDWGCEMLFFFNFNRVNMDITNESVRSHMEALFGAERLAALRSAVAELKGKARERAVLAAVMEMLREAGGQFIVPFRFVKDGSKRTSHYLIFASKNFLGYKIMRDVMAKASSGPGTDAVASFEFNTRPQLFLGDGRSVEALAKSLSAELAGTTMTVEQVFERHSPGKLYIIRNYKDALMRLEDEGRVVADPPKERRRVGTMSEKVTITFPRLQGSDGQLAASRSTRGRPESDLRPSVSARPTA